MADCIVLLSSDSDRDEEVTILPLIERISNKSPLIKRKAVDSDDDDLPSFADHLHQRKELLTTTSTTTVTALEDSTTSHQSTSKEQSTAGKRKKTKTLSQVEDQQIEERKENSHSTANDLQETKQQKLLKEKEAKRQERERKKAEKEQEKSLKKLVNQVENENRKETQPAHRVKQMIVQIDTSLSEIPELMKTLAAQLQELEVQYRVMPSSSTAHTVTWRRKKTSRSLNEDMTNVIEDTQEVDEQYMLVVMNGKEYVEHVMASKSGQSSSSLSLVDHVQAMIQNNPTRKIVILVENLDAALKAQKTKRNRNFRTAVRKNQADTVTIPSVEVSWFDCDSCMTEVYLETECCVRLCGSSSQVADMIVTYTRAIADIPYKKDSSFFSFYGDLGPGATKKALQESKNEIGLIWQHQLQQYPGVSNPVAAAIVSHYPSPSHLLKAYSGCNSTSEGDLLLKDIEVRRGAGIIASTRKVGPAISQRIHIAMTCEEPSNLLPN